MARDYDILVIEKNKRLLIYYFFYLILFLKKRKPLLLFGVVDLSRANMDTLLD